VRKLFLKDRKEIPAPLEFDLMEDLSEGILKAKKAPAFIGVVKGNPDPFFGRKQL